MPSNAHRSFLMIACRAPSLLVLCAVLSACSPLESTEERRTSSEAFAEADASDASEACRPLGSSLYDGKTADLVKPETQAWWDLEEICVQKTLMVFVGNGDSMGTIEFRTAVDAAAKQAIETQFLDAQQRFMQSIERAARDLDKTLEQNVCLSAFEKSFDAARAAGELPTLESFQAESYDVVKAEKMRRIRENGRITLATIIDGPGIMDSKISTRTYQWRPVNGVDTWQGDLAVSWEWQRSQQKLQQAAAGAAPFELNIPRQIGSLIVQLNQLEPAGMPADAHLATMTAAASKFDRVLYTFKTHGGLFTQATSKRPSLIDRSQPDSVRSVLLFDAHGDQGEILASDLYAPFWSKKNACDTYRSLGRQDLYAADGCDQKSAQAAISAGVAGIDSGYCSNTAGVGKSMLFDQKIVPASEANSDGILRMGEAVTYDEIEGGAAPRGLAPFKIINGAGVTEDSILLDSCYGSERVAKALESSLRGWPKQLVTISNSNPLYFDLIQYGSLNATEHLLLPKLFILAENARRNSREPLSEKASAFERAVAREAQNVISTRDALFAHFTGGLESPLGETAAGEQAYRHVIPQILFMNTVQDDGMGAIKLR